MTRRVIKLVCPVPRSYRTARVAGALDRPDLTEITTAIEFEEPPAPDGDWSVGLLVGGSGSGKSTVAQTCYPGALYEGYAWDGRPVVDNFAPRPFDALADALAAVGFASQTRWLRPYATLSGGERFRCDLAKALLDAPGPVVFFDEYATPVDRTVAQTASAALRNAFDRGLFGRVKLVAATCRAEVAEWLEPDWTLDLSTGNLARGRLRRPKLRLDVWRVQPAVWNAFKDYHYLSGSLNRASRCYAASARPAQGGAPADRLAAFAAVMQSEGRADRRRVHRLVVRPEYQGIGIGSAFLDALGELNWRDGKRLEIVTGFAPFARRLARSPRWRAVQVCPHGRTQRHKGIEERGSFGRATASFLYVPTSEK